LAPLPRYTPAGITIAAPQPVTAAAGQAAASLGRNISASLTQMSNFAFRQAMQQAVVEGAEYGADKAPTIEQIKRAQEDGDPVNVPGDTTTVFGRAARAQALSTMRLNVESAARNELAQMHANILKTEVPADQYAAQMNNLIKGYGDAIASASPTAAGALRASLATVASMQYKVHATQLAAKAEERRKIAMGAAVDSIVKNVDNIVRGTMQENEAWYAAGQEWLEAPDETMLASERNKILKLALSIGDKTLAQAALKRFNDSVSAARVDVAASMAQNEDGSISLEAERAFRSGNVAGTKMEAIYNSMSPAQRTAALNEMVRRAQQFDDVEAANEAVKERRLKVQRKELEMQFYDAFESRNPERIASALSNIHQFGDPELYERLKKIAVKKDYPTDPLLKVELVSRINAGEISRNRIMTEHSLGKLSNKDAIELIKMVKENSNSELTSNYARYKDAVGFPPSNVMLSQYTRAEAIRRVNAMGVILRNELNRVKATGEKPNFRKIVDDAIVEYRNATLSANDRKSRITSLATAMKLVPALRGKFDPNAPTDNKNLESMQKAIQRLQLENPKNASKFDLYLKNITDLIEDNDKLSAKSAKGSQASTVGFTSIPAPALTPEQTQRAIQTYGLGQ